MIVLYSGTPGSGKSLDCARTIYRWCRWKAPILCNFPVNVENIRVRGEKQVYYVPNDELNPDMLVDFSARHFEGKRVKEDSILLIIDESQLLFNARDWNAKGRSRWNWFFTMHRHFGYFIILCAQFDRMLDRQVRCLVEYEYIHRRVKNLGWRGYFLSCLMLSPFNLFVKIKVWYPMKEKVGSEFFKSVPKYYKIYDTYQLIDAPGARAERGTGAPEDRVPGVSAVLSPAVAGDTGKVQEAVEEIEREVGISAS